MEHIADFEQFIFEVVANNNFDCYLELVSNNALYDQYYINKYNTYKSIYTEPKIIYKKIDSRTF